MATDKCVRCGWVDKDDNGDYDSIVAGCSNCGEKVCGICWEKYHAETCSDD